MSKRQHRQSTADLRADHLTAKSKITDLFQQNTAETNDGVVELVCWANPAVVKLNFRIVNHHLLLVTYMYVAMNVGTNKL